MENHKQDQGVFKRTDGKSVESSRMPEGFVVHSLRHALTDRLSGVQCPSDMIDRIGDWSNAGVGQSYGEEY